MNTKPFWCRLKIKVDFKSVMELLIETATHAKNTVNGLSGLKVLINIKNIIIPTGNEQSLASQIKCFPCDIDCTVV